MFWGEELAAAVLRWDDLELGEVDRVLQVLIARGGEPVFRRRRPCPAATAAGYRPISS